MLLSLQTPNQSVLRSTNASVNTINSASSTYLSVPSAKPPHGSAKVTHCMATIFNDVSYPGFPPVVEFLEFQGILIDLFQTWKVWEFNICAGSLGISGNFVDGMYNLFPHLSLGWWLWFNTCELRNSLQISTQVV